METLLNKAKRSFARALKGSRKTNAERAKHRTRAKSALSRHLKRHPTTHRPAAPMEPLPSFAMGHFFKPTPTGPPLEAPYPKTHIPKLVPIRNTTIAKERAHRVANQLARRSTLRKLSGVPSRAEERRRVSISHKRAAKEANRASKSAARLHKAHAARKRVDHMSVVPESPSVSHMNDFFDRT